MNNETRQILTDMKRELADVELSIEQCADQGDVPMVEYHVEQQSFLTKEIKRIEEQDAYLQRVNSEDNGSHVSIQNDKYICS